MKIAVYLNSLSQNYQRTFYKGVLQQAKELGVSTICLQHDFFPLSYYVSADGVILLSSSFFSTDGMNRSEQLAKCFGGIPILSAGGTVPGLPSVTIRTTESMKLLMDHLLDVHGYTDFLFIGGFKTHEDNILRESIFEQSIQQRIAAGKTISYDCIHTHFTEYSSMQALAAWIKKNPGKIPQVLVCANDMIAAGAKRIVQIQEDTRWTQTAITGFDDIASSESGFEGLTTVRQPVTKLGAIALETAYKMVAREKIDSYIKIDSSFIVRQSCGCSLPNEQEPNATEEKQRRKAEQLETYVSQLGRQLNRADSLQKTTEFLQDFVINTDIPYFCLMLFSESEQITKEKADLVYEKSGAQMQFYGLEKTIALRDFFNSGTFENTTNGEGCVIYNLTSGRNIIGLMIYKTAWNIHAQMCNCALFVSAAIDRLNRLSTLEREVKNRTRELVIANQKLQEESNRRIAVEAQVLRISEMERQRFSMDLHDDICQRLAGISMLCKGLSLENPSLEELSSLIDETLHRTRMYAHDSFPVELKTLGLKKSLAALCESTQKEACGKIKLIFEWNAEKAESLDRDSIQQINIFRIAQEALHNAVKHSHADRITVSVCEEKYCKNTAIKLCITDNGKGSVDKEKNKQTGMGLMSMKYRADQIGAVLSIKKGVSHSDTMHTPTEGWIVELLIPQ